VAWMATASANDVSLSYERWARLKGVEEPVEVVAPGPRVASRELELAPLDEDRTQVVLRWRLDAAEPGWFDELVVGPMVTVDDITWRGRPATSVTESQGTRVTAWVDGPGIIELRGSLAQSPQRGPMALEALAAAIGSASVPRGWALEGDGVAWLRTGRWGATGARLAVVAVPEAKAKAKTLASASVGVGMTVSDAEVRVAARVVWRVARGQLPEVRFQVPSAGADLDVTGPLVASWRKEGSQVVVELRDKEAARIELTARWSQATPQGEQASVAVPQVTPADVYRTTYGLQVARDGEVEVVPAADGWEARAAAQLPPWARGLVEGSPTAAYITPRSQGASLQLYRFTPVPQPPTLIDVQQITAALTDEGRVLMRVSYAVRNERGAFLRVEPPVGLQILGAVVAGETAEPAADGDAWLLPLKKSVETVQGLLSFPVQLVLVGELDPWARKEERALGLPVVDAEVALSQVTVHLPPGYVGRHDDDEHGIVPAFSEGTGIAYGFSVGDARAAEADRLFQSAVSNWMSNSFDEAQQALDELQALGADNENVARLQSNLDLLDGKGSGGGGVALERRVKEQAKARSIDDARRQAAVLEDAEEALIRGDYDQAEAAYGEALKLGDKLGKLDQDEDLDNRFKNLEVEAKLAETRTLKKQKNVSKSMADEEGRRRAQEEAAARKAAEQAARAVEEEQRRVQASNEAAGYAERERAVEEAQRAAEAAAAAAVQLAPDVSGRDDDLVRIDMQRSVVEYLLDDVGVRRLDTSAA